MTLAHSDEPYMQKCGNRCKPQFYEQEHESKMRLLKTHSHISERRGNEADKVREQKRERKEGLTVRDWKKSPTKVIAMPPATGGGDEMSMEK